MKIVFLDAGTVGRDINSDVFGDLGEQVIYTATAPELIKERIADANVIITNKCKLTGDVMSAAPNLKLVCITATGYDNIDIDYAKAHGIAVCNVKGYSTNSVAQVTVAMALSLCCNLRQFNDSCKNGVYTASGVQNRLEPVFCELEGKTWGIYGFGDIGKKVAKIAEALGCKVLVCKKTPVDNYECVSLSELFERSDIITMHTPLTNETFHSVNEEILEKAKNNLVLVNTARGAVNDEAAVAKAVKNGKIAAYGTDVYSVEPVNEDNPIYSIKDMENVLLTPHMAWGAYESRVRVVEEVHQNIRAFLNKEVRNRVDL